VKKNLILILIFWFLKHIGVDEVSYITEFSNRTLKTFNNFGRFQ
jgi:hypothetical protein